MDLRQCCTRSRYLLVTCFYRPMWPIFPMFFLTKSFCTTDCCRKFTGESQPQWVSQLPLLVTTNQRLLFLFLLHFLLDPSLTAALRSVPLWLNPSQSLGNSQFSGGIFWWIFLCFLFLFLCLLSSFLYKSLLFWGFYFQLAAQLICGRLQEQTVWRLFAHWKWKSRWFSLCRSL